MSDSRLSTAFESIMLGAAGGAAAGATAGTCVAIAAETSAWVGAGMAATGALAGGLAVGGVVAVVCVYRAEIAELFETAWQGLKSLISGLFSAANHLLKFVMEMTEEIMNTIWQMQEEVVKWLENLFVSTNSISKEDKLTLIDTAGSLMSGMGGVVNDFGRNLDQVGKKAGISTQEITNKMNGFVAQMRDRLQILTDQVKAN